MREKAQLEVPLFNLHFPVYSFHLIKEFEERTLSEDKRRAKAILARVLVYSPFRLSSSFHLVRIPKRSLRWLRMR